MAVVFEATEDGYVACKAGVADPVVFDTREVSKVVQDLRDLQALALRGVRWSGIE